MSVCVFEIIKTVYGWGCSLLVFGIDSEERLDRNKRFMQRTDPLRGLMMCRKTPVLFPLPHPTIPHPAHTPPSTTTTTFRSRRWIKMGVRMKGSLIHGQESAMKCEFRQMEGGTKIFLKNNPHKGKYVFFSFCQSTGTSMLQKSREEKSFFISCSFLLLFYPTRNTTNQTDTAFNDPGWKF